MPTTAPCPDCITRRRFLALAGMASVVPAQLDREARRPIEGLVERVWRRTDGASLERFQLCRFGIDWILRGTVETVGDGPSRTTTYQIACDSEWLSRTATVRVAGESGETQLELAVSRSGEWMIDGKREPALAGCVDVDLAVTPATNTLPLRRLALGMGESRSVRAAWIRFPELEVLPMDQSYQRVGPRRYRYVSVQSGFTTDLHVDCCGVVIDYGDLWRAAPAPPDTGSGCPCSSW